MKLIVKNAMILFAITLVAGLLLGFVNEKTKGAIAQNEIEKQTNANKELFPEADHFSDEILADDAAIEKANAVIAENPDFDGVKLQSIQQALSKENEPLGYVISLTSVGYGGDIGFTVGISNEDVVKGISIISIAETPGLGMNAEKVLVPQYKDKKLQAPAAGNEQPSEGTQTTSGATTNVGAAFEVVKTDPTGDNQIEAISGATITSNAVTRGVNAAVSYFEMILKGGQ